MKFKNSELVEISNNINKMDATTVLPVKAAYAIVRNKHALQNALEAYWETRNGIISKYSNGGTSLNAKDNPEGFNKAVADISELDKEECDVDIRMVKADDLGTGEVPLNLIDAIGFMIED